LSEVYCCAHSDFSAEPVGAFWPLVGFGVVFSRDHRFFAGAAGARGGSHADPVRESRFRDRRAAADLNDSVAGDAAAAGCKPDDGKQNGA
jgi:hypothetical protein